MSEPADRIIVTVRGKPDEHDRLLTQSLLAGMSLNNYVRQQLGLPKTTRRPARKPQGEPH